MTAQIIPFQTKSDRLLALALAWYHHLKDDRQNRSLTFNRMDLIEEAAVDALAEDSLGWHYWEKGEDFRPSDGMAETFRGIYRDDKWGRTESLKRRLDDCLHGKWQRMKTVAPRRCRCRKVRKDVSMAQIIPFPTTGAATPVSAAVVQ